MYFLDPSITGKLKKHAYPQTENFTLLGYISTTHNTKQECPQSIGTCEKWNWN